MSREVVPALVVVVLYRCTLEASSTLRSLLAAQRAGLKPVRVLVFDNEPANGNETSPMLAQLAAEYVACPGNAGIRGGYELARQRAMNEGIAWLWLFDQDSQFSPGFMQKMAQALGEMDGEAACVAVLPQVHGGEQLLSPRVKPDGIWSRGHICLLPQLATVEAVNSGMLCRRTFVDSLGGFDKRFWLDGLDHWLCLAARRAGYRLAVTTAVLEHELSVVSKTGFVSLFRYQSILDSELILFREFYSLRERFFYALRLAWRCVKHPIRWGAWGYLGPTLRQLIKLCRREG
jgi:GT2 family glycosyltransferase